MSRTNKQLNFTSEQSEKKNSRLKNTQAFIHNNHLSGLLNNHKWQEIFDWIHSQKIPFEYKTLLSADVNACNYILENECYSVLLTYDGNFIDFFEFEFVKFEKAAVKKEIPPILLKLMIDFDSYYLIQGYRK